MSLFQTGFQPLRLSDVDDLPVAVQHHINAGILRHVFEFCLKVHDAIITHLCGLVNSKTPRARARGYVAEPSPVSSRGSSVGPATVSAKSMESITAVSVLETVPSDANTAITISKNKNQFSLKVIPHLRCHNKVCTASPKGARLFRQNESGREFLRQRELKCARKREL